MLDGDTLRVRSGHEVVTVRVACVDTEESLSGRPPSSSSKPGTVFGTETSLRVRALLSGVGCVRLRDPGPAPEEDAFGRRLAHVVLPDGRDLATVLVEAGASPYFTKYGRCRLLDAELRAAQRRARTGRRGIWDPRTNRPAAEGRPAALRPYGRLLPWWEARAVAVDAYRDAARRDPAGVLRADRADDLARGLARCARASGTRLLVFGEVERLFDERDGSLTVLLRRGAATTALRLRLRPAQRAAAERLDLAAAAREFRQNYVWAEGRLVPGPRGPCLVDVTGLGLAGPTP